MASHRAAIRAAALLAVVAAVLLIAPACPAEAQTAEQQTRRIAVIALPQAEARTVADSFPFGIGLGVFPDARSPARFIREIGAGDEANAAESFAQRLGRSGVARIAWTLDGPSEINEGLSAAFEPVPAGTTMPPPRAEIGVFSLRTAADADRVIRGQRGVFVLLGYGERTPLFIGLSSDAIRQRAASGVLTGGIARRPGIITPYDIAATLLDQLGVARPPDASGNVVTFDPAPNADDVIDGLAARLVRDADYAPGLAAVTVSAGVLSIIVGLVLARLGRRGALRVARGAVFVLPGWIAGVFIPSGRWEIRSIAVAAAVVLGIALPTRPDPIRAMAKLGFGAAIVFAGLVAVAPLNPGGEPGLSVWGNPLTSWRFFGPQNVPAAIIASGVVVWGA
ncbi:MAG: hypothetical protein L0221_02145, partial [Chloroflexi bacterium]|nr:hypothetical protein [Chloroflexota bacterium]